MSPSVTVLSKEDRAKVQNVVKSFVIVAVGTESRGSFLLAFQSSERGKAVDIRADNKRHNTTREGIDKREPVTVSFLKMKKFKERALDDKRTDFVFMKMSGFQSV